MDSTDPFSVRRRIEFSETDMAGIVHFSNFLRYMEFAEAALFREIGWSLFQTSGNHLYGWPRIKVQCRYRSPLRFEDQVRIGLGIEAIGERSIAYRFRFFKQREAPLSEEKVAVGSMTTCFSEKKEDSGTIISARMPEALVSLLQPYLLTTLESD